MRCRTCGVVLVFTLFASYFAATRGVLGDETTLAQPDLQASDIEAIAEHFRSLQNLEARRSQIVEAIEKMRRQKTTIAEESAASAGARPEFADNASSLKRDEFETKAEWEDRVAKARQLEKKQIEASQRSWDARKRQLASKEHDQLLDVEREITRLSGEENDVAQQLKRTRDEAVRDSWLVWRKQSPLSRYDLDRGVFPNLSCAASSVATPANRVLLGRGNLGGRQTALMGDLAAVNGKKSFEIHAPNREVAKNFKQDWADGKVLVASACKCTPRSIQPASDVVVSEAVTRRGPERSAPDYGSAAFNIIGGILNIAAGNNDPALSQYAGAAASDALNRTQSDVIVVQERNAFTADTIVVDVAVGPPALFRVVGDGKVEPYEGVDVK